MTKKAKKGKRKPYLAAELLIENYLKRRTIRSRRLAVTTTNIALAVKMPNDKTWRTLEKMHEKNKVDRTPTKGSRKHYLLNNITWQRYYGRNMERIFLQCAADLLRYATADPSILKLLNCTLADIRSLVSVFTDVDRYNRYIATLANKGVVTALPRLLWRSDPISWWLT